MDTASRIKLERQKRSWTQEQLAERAQLATRTVQRIEGGAEVSPETLRLIAEAFTLPAETLRAKALRTRFSPSYRRYAEAYGTFVFASLLIVFGLDTQMRGRSLILDAFAPSALLFLVPSMIFLVSGFSVKDGKLIVHFMGWTFKRDLSKLSAVEVNPQAFAGSFPLLAFPCCFAFVGFFYSSMFGGRYLGFITNNKACVVLEFGRKKLVVTPDDPEAFVEAVREAAKGVCAEKKQN